jgi:hypothetical protein
MQKILINLIIKIMRENNFKHLFIEFNKRKMNLGVEK